MKTNPDMSKLFIGWSIDMMDSKHDCEGLKIDRFNLACLTDISEHCKQNNLAEKNVQYGVSEYAGKVMQFIVRCTMPATSKPIREVSAITANSIKRK